MAAKMDLVVAKPTTNANFCRPLDRLRIGNVISDVTYEKMYQQFGKAICRPTDLIEVVPEFASYSVGKCIQRGELDGRVFVLV